MQQLMMWLTIGVAFFAAFIPGSPLGGMLAEFLGGIQP